jgi:hypothetical protein
MKYEEKPYKSNTSAYGGNIADYPDWEKQLRSVLFPDYKRRVEVKITTWMGISMGAVHYYVHFELEDDPLLILDPETGKYTERVCWDHPREHKRYKIEGTDYFDDFYPEDKEGDWEKFKDKFMDLEFAKKFAYDQVAKHFPPNKFDVKYDFSDATGVYEDDR